MKKKETAPQANDEILAFFDSENSDNIDNSSAKSETATAIKIEIESAKEEESKDNIIHELAELLAGTDDSNEQKSDLLTFGSADEMSESASFLSDSSQQTFLFEGARSGSDDQKNSDSEIRWNSIIEDLMREKRIFEIAQSYLPPREQVSWETFLVLQLFGKVAYLTGGQMLRFLEAWRKLIDQNIKFKSNIQENLINLGWIEQIAEPLIFRKGILKGRTIHPYYLTVKGFKYLQKEDVVTARLARFGEPKQKMKERLRHEVLISEVYIHLLEQGHYVIVILPEEELRRERIQSFWRQKTGRAMPNISYRGIGDFRILYFDREQNRIVNRDGEVAVRYTRNQILEKSGDLWWFCYDVVEAEKIEYITGQKPTVLTEKIFAMPPRRARKSRKPEEKMEIQVCQWSDLLGGLTIQTAAYLVGVHYNTAKKMLVMRDDLKPKYTWLQPGSGAGRGIKLFVKDHAASDPTAHHLTLVKNMTIQYLYENGFEVRRKGDELRAFDRKERTEYALIFDAGYYRMGDKWMDIIEEKRREIARVETAGVRAILAVGESENAKVFQKQLSGCTVISLSDYEFSYRK